MNVQKGTAAHLGQQAAGKTEFQHAPYNKAETLSSLTSEIGILLLCLQFPLGPELNHIGWGIFERLLRQYIDLGVLPQSVEVPPGRMNSRQPE